MLVLSLGTVAFSGERGTFTVESATVKPVAIDPHWKLIAMPVGCSEWECDITERTLRVKLPKDRIPLVLSFPEIHAAVEIFIDGKQVKRLGKIGTNIDDEEPRVSAFRHYFTPQGNEFELVIRSSNFQIKKRGLGKKVILSSPELLDRRDKVRFLFESTTLGLFIMMGIYHFLLFFSRSDHKSNLWFGIQCCCMTLRIFILSESYLVYSFIETVNPLILTKIEFLTYTFSVISMVLYIESIYSKRVNHILVIGFIAIGLIYSALVVFSSFTVYRSALPAWNGAVIIAFSYFLFIVVANVFNSVESRVLLIGFIGLFLTAFLDILYFMGLGFLNMSVAPLGMLMFLMAQSTLLSRRFFLEYMRLLKAEEEIRATQSDPEIPEVRSKIYWMEISSSDVFFDGLRKDHFVVIYADVNLLKEFNDNYGHKAGDKLLRKAAQTMAGEIRKQDYIFRIGGDEFLIILKDCDENHAKEVLNRIKSEVKRHPVVFEFEGKKISKNYHISFGLRSSEEGELDSLEEYREVTDVRMQENKIRFKEQNNIVRGKLSDF